MKSYYGINREDAERMKSESNSNCRSEESKSDSEMINQYDCLGSNRSNAESSGIMVIDKENMGNENMGS